MYRAVSAEIKGARAVTKEGISIMNRIFDGQTTGGAAPTPRLAVPSAGFIAASGSGHAAGIRIYESVTRTGLNRRRKSLMTISRTTLAIAGLVLSSVSLQAASITDASANGGTNFSSSARAQNGVLFGGSGSNFACPGGASSAGGAAPTNSSANITCESGRAFASADLVTGYLRGFALSSGIAGTTAFESALLGDTVTFNNSTGGNLLLGVSYLSHGTVEIMGASATTSLFSNLLFGQPGGSQLITLQGSSSVHGLRFVYVNGSTSIQAPAAGGPPDLSGWTVSPVGPIGALFSGTLVVPSGISMLDIATRLDIDCRYGGVLIWRAAYGAQLYVVLWGLPYRCARKRRAGARDARLGRRRAPGLRCAEAAQARKLTVPAFHPMP